MEENKRLEQISAQIVRLANADFDEPGVVSDKDDDLDSIIVGLNVLGEELESYVKQIAQLAAIVEYSSDAIISKTTEGYVTSWNRQAEILFGYSEKEMLGQHVSLLFPEGHVDEEERILAEIKVNHALLNYETERRRKDGKIISISSTISPIKDPSGKIIGVSNIARDITEKKAAEEKLLAYTTALEQKNKETEQFAYIASHDLQEPLRTITNYIGLLDRNYKGQLDEKADLYIGFISSASKRMQVLITDLLEYTRIENDKSESDVDCNLLLNEIVKDMGAVIEETHAELHFEKLPVVTGQYSRLKSLFQNLVSNAIKFRKPGQAPLITISGKDQGKEWLFEIKDNGIGIEKNYYDKIFRIFQRLHSRKEYQGTGIGLAHCKKIIDLRGGQIWVESEFGNGSSFYFTLPKNRII